MIAYEIHTTEERFNYYLDRFIQADTPDEKQKIIEEYTDVCFSQMEKELGNNTNRRIV